MVYLNSAFNLTTMANSNFIDTVSYAERLSRLREQDCTSERQSTETTEALDAKDRLISKLARSRQRVQGRMQRIYNIDKVCTEIMT